MINRKRNGVVLGVVVFTSLVLAAFIFGYHKMVIQQNRMAHREQLGEITGRLALNGLNLLAEYINSGIDIDTLIKNCAPTLFTKDPIPSNKRISGITANGSGNTEFDKILKDYNFYLAQLTNLKDADGTGPVCDEMGISFENVELISPGTDADSLYAGRDPVEKSGEVCMTCSVSYKGLRRTAKIRRQFKVVSMVPGIYARFTLFVPYSPSSNCYNSVGVKYNGEIDSTYEHPIPAPKKYAPLKIFNGTDSYVPGYVPDPKSDLANRGWIFLGPSRENPGTENPVILKIPSGYSNTAGGHFMFARPTERVNPSPPPDKFLVLPPELIEDPSEVYFKFDNSPTFKCVVGGLYQGFYTYDPDKGSLAAYGAGGAGLWVGLTTDISPGPSNNRYLCASSWLMPFGDFLYPSRTLVVGNVLAGFLKFYFIKDALNTPPLYSSKLTPRRDPAVAGNIPVYDPSAKIEGDPDAPLYKDVFRNPTSGLEGYDSYCMVSPKNFCPSTSGSTVSVGVAFNAFFDTMSYPGDQPGIWSYPEFGKANYVPIIQRNPSVCHPFFVPRYQDLSVSGGIPGIHPSELIIRFSPNDGSNPIDNFFFEGELKNYSLPMLHDTTSPNPLRERVTHIVDVSNCSSQNAENELLANLLFYKISGFTPLDHPGGNTGTWYIPKKPGIFYVRRRDNYVGAPLSLPPNIYLTTSLMIVVDQGDVRITGKILSPLSDNAPLNLFSLIVLDGNIILATDKEIDAYLVALKRGTGAGSQGGRLLSDGPTKMNIFGGLAIWEMGLYPNADVPTTMNNFPDGGEIRYNPRFNPSSPFYPKSHMFIMEDKDSSIVVSGGA